MELLGGINKDVCGAKLLPTTVSAYTMNFICSCHLVKTQHCCLCSCGRYNLPSAAHPPHHPPYTPSHPPTPLVCAICDITVHVKKVAENPAVLASKQKNIS